MKHTVAMVLAGLTLAGCECGPGGLKLHSTGIDVHTGPEAFFSNLDAQLSLEVQVSVPLSEQQVHELFQTRHPVELRDADGHAVQLTQTLISTPLQLGPGFTMRAAVAEPLDAGWYELVIDDFLCQFDLRETSRFRTRTDGRFSAFYRVGSLPFITQLEVVGQTRLSIVFSEPVHLTESSALQLSTGDATLACTLQPAKAVDGIEKVFDCDPIPDAFTLDLQANGVSGVPIQGFSGALPLAVELKAESDASDRRMWAIWQQPLP